MTHVGKLYGSAAPRIAQQIVARVEGVEEVRCTLVSRIGRPEQQD